MAHLFVVQQFCVNVCVGMGANNWRDMGVNGAWQTVSRCMHMCVGWCWCGCDRGGPCVCVVHTVCACARMWLPLLACAADVYIPCRQYNSMGRYSWPWTRTSVLAGMFCWCCKRHDCQQRLGVR